MQAIPAADFCIGLLYNKPVISRFAHWSQRGELNSYPPTAALSKESKWTPYIPAAGCRGSSLSDQASCGYYWSSTNYLSESDCADCLRFYSGYVRLGYGNDVARIFGFTVRPVLRK